MAVQTLILDLDLIWGEGHSASVPSSLTSSVFQEIPWPFPIWDVFAELRNITPQGAPPGRLYIPGAGRMPAFPGTGLKVVHRETLAVPRGGARGGGRKSGQDARVPRRNIPDGGNPGAGKMPAFPGAIFQMVATPVRAGCPRSQAQYSRWWQPRCEQDARVLRRVPRAERVAARPSRRIKRQGALLRARARMHYSGSGFLRRPPLRATAAPVSVESMPGAGIEPARPVRDSGF